MSINPHQASLLRTMNWLILASFSIGLLIEVLSHIKTIHPGEFLISVALFVVMVWRGFALFGFSLFPERHWYGVPLRWVVIALLLGMMGSELTSLSLKDAGWLNLAISLVIGGLIVIGTLIIYLERHKHETS